MRWSKRLISSLVLSVLAAALADSQSLTLVHKKKYVMGTVFEVVAYHDSPTHASNAIDEAFQEIARLDSIMSNYKSDSDLSRLNRTAHFHAESVSPDLYRVIETSLRYSKLSDGEFDITVGPLVNFWKSVIRGERSRSPGDEANLRKCVGYNKIVLLPPDRIEFRCPSLQIDLGAIGKGYAVDRVVAILRSHGISKALVNAGGSTIYGMGFPPGESAWRVRLRDPSGKNNPEVLLSENSVSTSEQTASSLFGDNQAGHIIDPQNGEPVKTAIAVTVLAQTATDSDALSTTLLLLGPQKGSAVVKGISEAAAIWIAPSGQVETASSGPRISFVREGHPQIARERKADK